MNAEPLTCAELEANASIERYLAGTLPETDSAAFEEHYFSCDHCFETLRVQASVREALLAAGAPAARPLRPPVPRVWVAMACAAGLLAGLVVYRNRAPAPVQQVRPPEVESNAALLARMDPPAYAPQQFRGAPGVSDQRFEAAMQNYTRGQYATAIPGLRLALQADPSSARARYFLGICLLLTGEVQAGKTELGVLTAPGNASPFLEEAHFYSGKAWLKQGKPEEARREFEQVVAMQGDLTAQARDILARLGTRPTP